MEEVENAVIIGIDCIDNSSETVDEINKTIVPPNFHNYEF